MPTPLCDSSSRDVPREPEQHLGNGTRGCGRCPWLAPLCPRSLAEGRAPLLPTVCGTGVPTGLLPTRSNTPGTQALTAVGDAVPGPLSTKGLLHSLTQISSFAPSHSPRLLGTTPFPSTPEQPSWRGWLQPCTGPASPF